MLIIIIIIKKVVYYCILLYIYISYSCLQCNRNHSWLHNKRQCSCFTQQFSSIHEGLLLTVMFLFLYLPCFLFLFSFCFLFHTLCVGGLQCLPINKMYRYHGHYYIVLLFPLLYKTVSSSFLSIYLLLLLIVVVFAIYIYVF